MYKNFLKLVIDFMIAFIALLLIWPIMLIVAIAVKLDSKGPIIFKQQRLGKNGKVFNMYKFRTMVVNAEAGGVYSNNKDPRITRVGNILRKTSLDELPQLFNILKGDMSLIGFRPPLTYHPWPFSEYTEEQKKMFARRPGITGWAQVNGRKEIEWNKRIELNVWYAQNVSFWLDMKIFFKTIFKVFSNSNNENIGETVKKKGNIKLMYITNNPQVATICENAGVDRIFIDMEYIGKNLRQGGLDTVQNHHTIEDVKNIASQVKKAEVLVRVNPIHDQTEDYVSSKEEIDLTIQAGAQVIMLPYFKSAQEVETFVKYVDKRAKTMLLVETPEAVENIDQILSVDGIDEILIGLNDLSLGYKKKFMFELVADGTVEKLCNKFKEKNIPYGFGGIARLHTGILPAEYVIGEHYRLGSTIAILSRNFCNTSEITDYAEIEKIFNEGIKEMREFENSLEKTPEFFEKNKQIVIDSVNKYIGEK